MVKAELWHGAHKYGNLEKRLNALRKMFRPFVSLPFDDAAMEETLVDKKIDITATSGMGWKFMAKR